MKKIAATTALAALALSSRAQATTELPEFVVKNTEASLAGTAPILGGSLIGTPVATTVIPKALTVDQHQITLRDALENSAGVNSSTGNGVHDFFVVRGVDSLTGSMVLFDGVPEPEASFYSLYNVKEVHVLKGPGAFFFGGNSLAGSVNLVRESASTQAKKGGELTLEAGSFGTFGQELDVQAPGLRLNQFYRRSDGYRDGMDFERYGVNPSLVWGHGPRRSSVQIEYARSEATPDAGIPTLGDRILDVSRKASFQDADEQSEQDIIRAVMNHEIDLGKGTLRSKTYFNSLEWKSTGSVFAGFVPFALGLEPQPATLARYKPSLDDEQNLLGTELEWLGETTLGGLKHHFLAGAEASRFTDEYTLATNPGESIHLPTGMRFPGFLPPLPLQQGDATSDVLSLYGADRVDLAKGISLVLGARADWLSFEDDAQKTSRDDDQISPFAGITIPLNPQVALFADAGEGFAPPSTLTSGPRRAPEESRQYEGGLKFATADGAWSGQIAGFQIERENIAIPDSTGILRQNGDQTSTGAEVELAGKLSAATTVSAQYAYLDSELEKYSEYQGPQAVAYDGATAPFAPEQIARLWVRQDLGQGFGVGAGARFTGEQFIHPDNRLELDATTVFDAAIYYTAKTWDAAVNFENIGDEEVFGRGVSSTSVRPEDGFGVFGTVRVRL